MPKGLPTIQPAKSVEYTTPKETFDELSEEVGGFNMDPFCRPYQYTAQKVLENGGAICVPPGSAYSGDSWMSALTHADRSRVLVDGLAQPWHGKVWFQPPYGLPLAKSVPYAVHQVECGNAELVMGLLPAKTEVRWFQEYILQRVQTRRGPFVSRSQARDFSIMTDKHPLLVDLRFVKGRLHFGGGEGPARVGNIIVVWRK